MNENLARGLVMDQTVETPLAFDPEDFGTSNFIESGESLGTLDGVDRLDWLMSLALDEELGAREASHLELMLAQEPRYLERWDAWQTVDGTLHQLPYVLPPMDFAAKFEARLAIRERRQRLRTGAVFALVAIALWGSALGGTILLGALVWTNQSLWLSGLVHNMAYWWSALGQFAQAFGNAALALWSVPQTRTILLCYFVAAAGILATWFVFLRQSVRQPVHMMPAVEN